MSISERKEEELYLKNCMSQIEGNIESYAAELKFLSTEIKRLYDNYRSNNPELHNDLVMALDRQSLVQYFLDKNSRAKEKPYFGRIKYTEHGEEQTYSVYIGKNGVMKDTTHITVVDWRAPISSVYYDSEVGESYYMSPYEEKIHIKLHLKRTFEMKDGKLLDYFDTDVIANDEFLIKYLSQSKEVVLGEIIATIQKEQNAIIRDTPWHTVIVQGVAGSGKTTVAMHRISYLLYNYKEKLRADEFYIIGSNQMLLNYITGVLPNLDVTNINQMTLAEFFCLLLDKDFSLKKNKFILTDPFQEKSDQEVGRFKGSLSFIRAWEKYLTRYEETVLTKPISYQGKVLYSEEDLQIFFDTFRYVPLYEKVDMLNKRLAVKIRNYHERYDPEMEKEEIRQVLKPYQHYFGKKSEKINYIRIYEDFLTSLLEEREWYASFGFPPVSTSAINTLKQRIHEKKVDIYELAMLVYLKKRQKSTQDFNDITHIVIDEAQDFGVLVFDVLRKLLKDCTYTIMGDVSQNIYYDIGMNDWEELKSEVFSPESDKFYLLAKSYRNTVEISAYATNVLKKCTFHTYEIEPIIRHGIPVEVFHGKNKAALAKHAAAFIHSALKKNYDTTAVICRNDQEANEVKTLFTQSGIQLSPSSDQSDMTFTSGVMVLPLAITKGLEFDTVILWNPVESSYPLSDASAKLLYVAITRALHELLILHTAPLSSLLLYNEERK